MKTLLISIRSWKKRWVIWWTCSVTYGHIIKLFGRQALFPWRIRKRWRTSHQITYFFSRLLTQICSVFNHFWTFYKTDPECFKAKKWAVRIGSVGIILEVIAILKFLLNLEKKINLAKWCSSFWRFARYLTVIIVIGLLL